MPPRTQPTTRRTYGEEQSTKSIEARAGTGVVAALGAATIKAATMRAQQQDNSEDPANDQDHDEYRPVEGPLANATINFGAWKTDPALDRFAALSPPNPANTPNNPNSITGNHHALTPHDVTIQAGKTVNFVIGGFHHVLIYDDGTQLKSINANAQNPFFTLLIDDPNHRIYRGLNPQTVLQDRVETVHFAKAGTFLVICGVSSAFRQRQHVRVCEGASITSMRRLTRADVNALAEVLVLLDWTLRNHAVDRIRCGKARGADAPRAIERVIG